MVSWLSNHYNGNPNTLKDDLYIETTPCSPWILMWVPRTPPFQAHSPLPVQTTVTNSRACLIYRRCFTAIVSPVDVRCVCGMSVALVLHTAAVTTVCQWCLVCYGWPGWIVFVPVGNFSKEQYFYDRLQGGCIFAMTWRVAFLFYSPALLWLVPSTALWQNSNQWVNERDRTGLCPFSGTDTQGSFCVCTQPMRDNVTL